MWHIYLGAVTLGLSVLLLNLLLNLRALHRLGSEKHRLPDDHPMISILVPARNEERDIVACLESLQKQDYPAYEVLVLDDSSTDRTGEMVARIAARDPRVRLLRGEPLPPGWAGKPHACHQLAAAARGEWLLFTDADTIHAPDMLTSALTYALAHRLSLVSGFPFQKTSSFSQRVVIPAMWSIVVTCMPLWWVQGARRPKAGLVIGQFIFVSAADYREVGGHEAVRGRIIEDVWLGITFARRGKRLATVDLTDVVTTRMYEGVGDLWEGFSKWTYSITAFMSWLFAFIVIGVVALFIAPFVMMVSHVSPWLPNLEWFTIIMVQVVLVLVMRILIDRRFDYPRRYFVSYPLGVFFLLVSGVWGSVKALTGRGVSWKDRTYRPTSKVS